MYQFATLRYLKTHGELVDEFLTIPFRRLTIIVATSATGLTMTAIAVLLFMDRFFIEAAVFMAINMPCLFLMSKIYLLHKKKKEE
jgi:predicted membrane protein